MSATSRQKKVGLALGSGAARGMAHIGVLEVLEREGIPIDLIAGTSAGALVGAIYARSQNIDELKKTVLGLDWKRRAQLIDLTLPRTGFIGGRKLKALARTIMGDVDFGNLKIPFACVATDVMTGEEVVIRQGPVLDAVRASISLPIIFAVAKWQGRYLVDGVLVNPVPVNVLKDMGAGFIIAVNVIPRTMERMHADSQRGKQGFKEPNLFSVILQSTHIAVDSRLRASLEGADIVIEPHLESIGYADFHQCPECIRQGELAARRLLPEIKRRLQG